MIARNVAAASQGQYDLVIVGGGIYGACTFLEASKRGLKALLLERDDFGGATSWNSFRIIHGGLRYLQSFNVKRYFASVAERRWFLQNFPDLVKPLPFMMPLYGDGLKRSFVMRIALVLNELMGASCGIAQKSWRRGCVLSAADTMAVAPFMQEYGLRGSAVWCDAMMSSPQRIIIEIINWACRLGGTALNYVKVCGVKSGGGRVKAAQAVDRTSGNEHVFTTRCIANCAGPWVSEIAENVTNDSKKPLFMPSLAFNVLLDREPLSNCALAISPRAGSGGAKPVYFMYPLKGKILAGTAHVPSGDDVNILRPSHSQVERMLHDLNSAVPDLGLNHEDVLRVYSGLLPVRKQYTNNLATCAIIHEHAKHGGPKGLLTIRGVKFTTARRVAERAVHRLFPDCQVQRKAISRPIDTNKLDLLSPESLKEVSDQRLQCELRRLVQDEAIMCMEDLLLRRTDWLADPREGSNVMGRISPALPDLPLRIDDDSGQQSDDPETMHTISTGGKA